MAGEAGEVVLPSMDLVELHGLDQPLAAPAGREVALWSADLRRVAGWWPRAHALLSADERERAARFRFPRDAEAFVLSRAVLRHVLGRCLDRSPAALAFTYGRHGKPDLEGGGDFSFNLSHAGERVLIGVTRTRRIGVDLERFRDLDHAGIGARYFPVEAAAIAALPEAGRRAAFFACWTRKEAFVKALGAGLNLPLDEFEVSLDGDGPAPLKALAPHRGRPGDWLLRGFAPAPGYVGAVAVEAGGA